MSVKFCPKCGNQLKENVKFCPKCGTSLKVANEKSYIQNDLTLNHHPESEQIGRFFLAMAAAVLGCALMLISYRLTFIRTTDTYAGGTSEFTIPQLIQSADGDLSIFKGLAVNVWGVLVTSVFLILLFQILRHPKLSLIGCALPATLLISYFVSFYSLNHKYNYEGVSEKICRAGTSGYILLFGLILVMTASFLADTRTENNPAKANRFNKMVGVLSAVVFLFGIPFRFVSYENGFFSIRSALRMFGRTGIVCLALIVVLIVLLVYFLVTDFKKGASVCCTLFWITMMWWGLLTVLAVCYQSSIDKAMKLGLGFYLYLIGMIGISIAVFRRESD